MNEGRRYRVLGVLGRGGFGTVYRADLLGEGDFVRPVALKVLNADMEEVASVAARLRDEARLLGRIRHRSVVQVDGLVRLDDRWTIVMEYVDGVDLGRLLGDTGAVPARAAFEIVGEVASALHVVQTWPGSDGRPLGLLHRDLKPANLVVTAAGEVKVLDFGVARANFETREAHTKNLRFGSPGYVAPERLEGEERPEGDVYSLGVVLHELLTAGPFGKATVRRERHAENLDARIAALPTLPPEAVALLRRMLAWEPGERPSAREVERACRDVAPSVPGEYLRDWAERVVPGALAARPLGSAAAEFSSSLLTERVSSAVVDPGPTAPSATTDTLSDFAPPSRPATREALPAPRPGPPALPAPARPLAELGPPPSRHLAELVGPPPPPLPPRPATPPPVMRVEAPRPPRPPPPPDPAATPKPVPAGEAAVTPRGEPKRLGLLAVVADLLLLSAATSGLVVVMFVLMIAMCMGSTFGLLLTGGN